MGCAAQGAASEIPIRFRWRGRRNDLVSHLSRSAIAPLVRRGSLRLMYVELHSCSAFSFLEAASLPEDLVAEAARLEMPAIALLDRDGVYGSPRFHMAATKAKIKAHIGAEVTCENFSPQRHRVTEQTINHKLKDSSASEPALSEVEGCLCGKFRLPLLVSSRIG